MKPSYVITRNNEIKIIVANEMQDSLATMFHFGAKARILLIVAEEIAISLATCKSTLAELALDVFDSSCELLFADQCHDVCDTQTV